MELLVGLQLSSAEKLIPCSGASGPTSPDQTNNFIMRRDGEANDARHSPALPSAVGASAVNCDCRRNGFTSAAQPSGRQVHSLEGRAPGVVLRFLHSRLSGGLRGALRCRTSFRRNTKPSVREQHTRVRSYAFRNTSGTGLDTAVRQLDGTRGNSPLECTVIVEQ